MNGVEKSDSAILAVKSANKGASVPAESMERRTEPKGNSGSQSTCRTQRRESVTQAADRTRVTQVRANLEGGPTSARRRWSRSQHGPGVVVGTRILGVRILGEDNELAHIVGPVAEGVKVERAPKRGRRRRGLHPREGVSVTHTPPAVHVGLRRNELDRHRTPESREEARMSVSEDPNGHPRDCSRLRRAHAGTPRTERSSRPNSRGREMPASRPSSSPTTRRAQSASGPGSRGAG